MLNPPLECTSRQILKILKSISPYNFILSKLITQREKRWSTRIRCRTVRFYSFVFFLSFLFFYFIFFPQEISLLAIYDVCVLWGKGKLKCRNLQSAGEKRSWDRILRNRSVEHHVRIKINRNGKNVLIRDIDMSIRLGGREVHKKRGLLFYFFLVCFTALLSLYFPQSSFFSLSHVREAYLNHSLFFLRPPSGEI